jgi:restriction system protein
MPLRLNMDDAARMPTFDRMLMPTLEALKQLGGSGSIQEIGDKVIQLGGYSEKQQAVLHGPESVSRVRCEGGFKAKRS